MSICTKFKIASMISLSWQRCQLCSNSSQNDKGSKNYNEQNGPTPNPPDDGLNDKCSSNWLLKSGNTNYIEYLYLKWVQNPKSVHNSWNTYFSDILIDHHVSKLNKYLHMVSAKDASIQKVPVEGRNESDKKNYKVIFQKLNKTNGSRSVEAIQAKQQISKGPNDDVWITGRQPQDPDCVVGHIILSPKVEGDEEKDKQRSSEDTIKAPSKTKAMPNNQQTKPAEAEKSSIEDEHEKAMKCVRAALKQRLFCKKSKYINEKLLLITKKKMQKSLERKKPGTDS